MKCEVIGVGVENLTLGIGRDFLGLFADILTIWGVSGVIILSFMKKTFSSNSVPDIGINLFVIMYRVALSILTVLVLMGLASFFFIFTILFSSGDFGEGDGIWNTEKIVEYLFAYFMIFLIFFPLTILLISSIMTCSLSPFRIFWKRLRNK